MQDKQLLIVGIDPGTTLGYSVFDINGNVLETNSTKLLNLDLLTARLTSLGRIVVIGTDKRKVPAFIDKLRRKSGAKLITPSEDLKKEEKSRLASGYNIKNTHEKDALSSAVFSYNKLKPLFTKIDSYLNICKKSKYSNSVKELLLTENNLNISSALELVENSMLKKKQKSIMDVVRVLPETDKVDNSKSTTEESSESLKLKRKNFQMEREVKLLKGHAVSLKNELARYRRLFKLLEKKISVSPNKKAKEILRFREKRIYSLTFQIELMKKESSHLNDKISSLNLFISNLNNNILLKKLDTLSWQEFLKKNKVLNIKQDDVLFVNNPCIVSDKTLDSLKDVVNVIVHNQDTSRKLKDKLGFIFIDSKEFDITENELFGLVDKEMFNKVKNNKGLLNTIIKEYKSKKE
ncbi:MAG: DUF460 domain-containing protein [Candidatus Woesearchaeota archaeon]|jgi:hypothetical protein|nr:DUF460 domain-containing protein [Candidatus Woesearchaeota archaeon]MDP7610640.1 DUF460 domain-containing protein [Candidatus Woesearchaeota archaeon]|tara:strand:+ start:988 stop:2208 length:1221 start_codon:yes stop_codon:yes gene_type:complete